MARAPAERDSGRAAPERATVPDQAAPVRVGQGWAPAVWVTVLVLVVWVTALVLVVWVTVLAPVVSVRVAVPAVWATVQVREARASVRAVSVTGPAGETESGTGPAVRCGERARRRLDRSRRLNG
jgi:hypothetical protein